MQQYFFQCSLIFIKGRKRNWRLKLPKGRATDPPRIVPIAAELSLVNGDPGTVRVQNPILPCQSSIHVAAFDNIKPIIPPSIPPFSNQSSSSSQSLQIRLIQIRKSKTSCERMNFSTNTMNNNKRSLGCTFKRETAFKWV
jgi:hypothetical protein